MSNPQTALNETEDTKVKAITVEVNRKPVTFEERRVKGSEIKATAIAQGVEIQPDFALFEIKGQGKLKPVGDDEVVTLTKNSQFRAVAPDDNS